MTARVAKEEIAMLMPSRLTHYFTDDREDLPQGEASATGTGLGGLFARLRTWLAARRANEEAVAELARLSDHELADIGLVRSDLLRVTDPDFALTYNAERAAAGAYGIHPEHAHS